MTEGPGVDLAKASMRTCGMSGPNAENTGGVLTYYKFRN